MNVPSSAAVLVTPGSFEPDDHFYPRVLNAQIHPLVLSFLNLGNRRIVERYCHLHPEVDRSAIQDLLNHETSVFRWGGADLFVVATEGGTRRVVLIETNSCPSGQKSMPRWSEDRVEAGYRVLLERSFLPMLSRRGIPKGELAVLYDKNPMEASGYAATLADLTGESVFLVSCYENEADPCFRFDRGLLQVREAGQGIWRPIRAALRYVTQRPWNRIPVVTRTAFLNPVLACLAGGRNKMLAAKAYDFLRHDLPTGSPILRTPETIWEVSVPEVPFWVERMGGAAVIKDPYSNAGQGVFTITCPQELDAFMKLPHRYDHYIVQSLIGNVEWSSRGQEGSLYHVGTVPDRKDRIFVSDLRMMVGSGPNGFFPVAIYARKARSPLTRFLDDSQSSWDMLGTNLSLRTEDGSWSTQTERLLLMDSRDFNQLGLGLDDLIEGYLQSVLAVTAIDQMSLRLLTSKGLFRKRLFRSLNPDPSLLAELMEERKEGPDLTSLEPEKT